MTSIQFSNGYILKREVRDVVLDAIMKTLKEQLPTEAQTVEVAQYILDDCSGRIKTIRLDL